MVLKCIAKHCPSHSKQHSESHNITYHPFPTNREIFNTWVLNMQLKEEDVLPSSTLCSLHFAWDCFIKSEKNKRCSVLHVNAVPTVIFMDSSEMSEPGAVDEKSSLICSAYQCNNSPAVDTHLSYFSFPMDDEDRLGRWVREMRWDEFVVDSEKFLCSEHFDESCFGVDENGETTLLASAVPTNFIYPDEEAPSNNFEERFKSEINSAFEDDSSDPFTKLITEVTADETVIEEARHHDKVVDNLLQKADLATRLTNRVEALATRKRHLDALLNAVISGHGVPKDMLKTMKPIIKEVDDICDIILEHCSEPCGMVDAEDANQDET